MLLAVIAGVPMLRTGFDLATRPPMTAFEWWFYAVIMLATIHLVIAVHEAGHVLGGWLAGFRFRFVVVGPLRIERSADGIRLRLNRSLRHYGGLAGSASGPGNADAFRRGWIVQAAAGPLLSLLAGTTAWFAVRGLAVQSTANLGFAGFTAFRAMVLFAAGSLAVGLITGLPGGTADRPTDTSRIIHLLRGDLPTSAPRPASTE